MTEHLAARPLLGLPLVEGWFALLFAILGTFLFLDGFDFGAGAIYATRDDRDERETILAAIGPFWHGNEVWLVVFGGALFAAFPPVYANLFSRHYLLLFGVLGALILRGLAPKMYEQRDDPGWQRAWGRSFAVGSVATPFLLGLFVASWLTGSARSVTLAGVVLGAAVVALTVVTGAAFLRLKTEGAFRDALRRYGEAAVVAYLALVVVALGAIHATNPPLRDDLGSPPVLALVGLSALLGVGYLVATRRDATVTAFGLSGALVYALVAVVAVLLYPAVDPATNLTVHEAVVSTLPLNLMSVAAAVLLPLVALYFVVLYSSFSGPAEAGHAY